MPLGRRAGCTGCLGHGTLIAGFRRCDLKIGANVTIPRARHHRGPRRCTSVSRNLFFAAFAPRRVCALSKYWKMMNQPIITLPVGGSHGPHICFRAASKAAAPESLRMFSARLTKGAQRRKPEPTSSALLRPQRSVGHSPGILPMAPGDEIPCSVGPPQPKHPLAAKKFYLEPSVSFSFSFRRGSPSPWKTDSGDTGDWDLTFTSLTSLQCNGSCSGLYAVAISEAMYLASQHH